MLSFKHCINRCKKLLLTNNYKYKTSKATLYQWEQGEEKNDEFEELFQDEKYLDFKSQFISNFNTKQQVYVIQPWIKWGPDKLRNTTAELMLDETATLAETVPNLNVIKKQIITGTNFNKPYFFGKGNIETIAEEITKSSQINCLMIGCNMLNGRQQVKLENIFGVHIYDRYSIVLKIFAERASTKEARLQTALAEIPYIKARLKQAHDDVNKFENILVNFGGKSKMYFSDRRDILYERERKLRKQLDKLYQTRSLHLKTRQEKLNKPIVAVVGYTNCGKTTMICQLTKDVSLQPLNQLFATLDVSYHQGRLNSGQNVFFMDTIGFISNIPTGLVGAFNAALKEISSAHLILHVYDISHPDVKQQIETVQHTLTHLINLPETLNNSILNVANKVDLIPRESIKTLREQLNIQNDLIVSMTELINMAELKEKIEKSVNCNFGFSNHKLKFVSSGPEYGWLLKNAVINDISVDEQNANYFIVKVQILDKMLKKSMRMFPKMEILTENYDPNPKEDDYF